MNGHGGKDGGKDHGTGGRTGVGSGGRTGESVRGPARKRNNGPSAPGPATRPGSPNAARAGDDFPLALDPPPNPTTPMDAAMIEAALEASRRSPRKRIIQPLHKTAEASLHRMLNVLQPGTYIRPHRHLDPPKAESLVVLQGRIGFATFDEAGEVTGLYVLGPDEDAVGIDMEPGVYHTFVVLEPDTVLFEVKPGPYAKATDKAVAAWAPEEFTDAAREYVDRLAGMF